MNRFRSRRHRPTNTPRRIQAFRLEPLRTPSGLLDSSDDLSVPFIDALSDPIDPVELPDLDFDLAALDTPDPELVSPFNSGTFTVGETGTISVDYLFDGGGYQGELGFFSLDGLEDLEPGSEAFIQAAANRALSNSELGHLVIQDANEGARFSESFAWEGNLNRGEYQGIKTIQMRPGDRFAAILIPKGRLEDLALDPSLSGAQRPLFSLATANPDDGLQLGQIADVSGDGQTFAFEDLRLDGASDRDYNDLIFRVDGAKGEALQLGDAIASNRDWRDLDLGQELIDQLEPIDWAEGEEGDLNLDPDSNPNPSLSPDLPPTAEVGGDDLMPILEFDDLSELSESLNLSQAEIEQLAPAVEVASEQLIALLNEPEALEQLQLAFGDNWTPEQGLELIQQLQRGENWPGIELLPRAELLAEGAYAAESETIYLAQEFLSEHQDDPTAVAKLLLEEFGHHLDAQLNPGLDAPGDEGAIFAALVMGARLEEAELNALRYRDDQKGIVLAGQPVDLEQNDQGVWAQ